MEQGGAIAIIKDDWKYISPNSGTSYNKLTGFETGNLPLAQLYNLKEDIGVVKTVHAIHRVELLMGKEKLPVVKV